MTEYKVARVHWIDAWFQSGWYNADGIDELAKDDYLVESVGWLVKDEPECVVLALSVSKYKAGDLLRIPRAYIKEMFINEQE